MANKNCPSCGYPNVRRAKKCVGCGYDFDSGLNQPEQSGTQSIVSSMGSTQEEIKGNAFTGQIPLAEFGPRVMTSMIAMIAILLVVIGYPLYITITTGNISYMTGYLPYFLIYIVLISISMGRKFGAGRLYIYENGFRTKKGNLDLSFDYTDIESLNPLQGARGTQGLILKLNDGRRMSFPNYRMRSKGITLEAWFNSKITPHVQNTQTSETQSQ
ncbi:MAG: hypothetical protein ACYDAO_06400 [Thermoplasmataceae archaeon]